MYTLVKKLHNQRVSGRILANIIGIILKLPNHMETFSYLNRE